MYHSGLLTAFVVYLVLLFLIAAYAARSRSSSSSLQAYYLGNRGLGGCLLAMTLTTSYISASSFIGGPGAAYHYGLGWVAVAMIQLPVVWFTLGVLGKKFAILARRYQAITLNDLLYARYQSRLLLYLSSISLLVAFFATMTVQFIGAARLLQTVLGLPYGHSLLIFGATITLYTLIGGFRAMVLTDLLQGLIMLLGSGLLLQGVITAGGGLAHTVHTLQQIDPQLITPSGTQAILTAPLLGSFWILVCFGTLGLPHTATSCMAYKNSRAMHQAMVIGTAVLGIVMLAMHLSGALGRALVPDLLVPDQIIPTLMMTVLSPIAAGIFLAAPLSAIMSTVDAQLLQCSATVINDLYLRYAPQAREQPQRLARYSRVVILLLSLLLLLAAWHPPKLLIWLNLFAFGGLQVVFLWPLVLGLYWPAANATGALSSFLAGVSSYLCLSILSLKPWGLQPIVPALLVSLAAFYGGNRWGVCQARRDLIMNQR